MTHTTGALRTLSPTPRSLHRAHTHTHAHTRSHARTKSPTRLHALAAALCLLAVPTGGQATDAASPAAATKNFTFTPIDAETMRVS